MHYSRSTFAKNPNLDTILPREDPVVKVRPEIGQRVKLSNGDIAQTNMLYRCPSRSFLSLLMAPANDTCIFPIECGRTIQDAAGSITSPNYPSSSPPAEGEFCEWRITATHGERIVLNISDIDIFESNNCENGFLEVRDGYWIKSPLLGKSTLSQYFAPFSPVSRLPPNR